MLKFDISFLECMYFAFLSTFDLLLAILFLFLLSVTGMTGLAGRSVIRCMCVYFPYLFHFMRIFSRLLRLVYLVVTEYGAFNLVTAVF